MTRDTMNRYLGAILETIHESPTGAPLVAMFAALQAVNVTLEDFSVLMSLARDAGLVRISNQVAFLEPKGMSMVAQIQAHKVMQ